MTLEDRIIDELKKYPPSAAIAGTQLAEALDESWNAILAASRELETRSRERGNPYIIVITNQRPDRSDEPPNEFYVHLSYPE
jgi:hypothetical protein